MSAKIISEAVWEKLVEKAKGPVLVEFVTPSCPNCASMKSIVNDMADKYSDKLQVYTINAQTNTGIAAKHGIQGVPTFKFFCKGEVVSELVGEVYPPLLERSINDVLQHGNECAAKRTKVSWDMNLYG